MTEDDDEPTVPVSVLRDLADGFERDANANHTAANDADDVRLSGIFAGKAQAYDTAAKRLREYADGAEKDSPHH